MEVRDFPLHLEYVMYSGYSIPREEQIILTWSLRELQTKNKFDETYFWGIIYGEKADYYIAFGVRKDFMKGRRYFYSLNCEEWILLPQPNPDFEHKVLISHTLLTGDPSFQLEVIDDAPQEKEEIPEEPTHDTDEAVDNILATDINIKVPGDDEDSDAEKEPAIITENSLKEEDRLSYMVKLITEECAIIPRGAFIKQLNGKVVRDSRFMGLDPEEALEFRSYFHLRHPRLKFNDNLLKRKDSDICIDILDTIDDDVPHRKTWTIRSNDDDLIVIKNLTWPGMMFYHKCNTTIYGFIYIGFGMRNLDLSFML